MRTVTFWFDYASTYSYLSVMRISALAARQEVTVRWQPFLLGPVFAAAGWTDAPFNALPAKGRYMWQDLARQARKHGLPWQRPAQFPKRSVLAVRVGVLGQDSAWIADYSRAVMQANFVLDLDIDSPEVISGILDHLGLPGALLVEQAVADDNRARLRTVTETALARGVFGAPTFFAGGEMFWGDDRLEDALGASLLNPLDSST